jgi:hypothetical protein
MADKKSNRGRSRKQFAQVKGKVLEDVEIDASDNGCTIGILFQDKTYLSFDVEAELTISPELSDWKKGEYKPIKRWPTIHS